MPKVIKIDNFKYLTNDDWRTLVSVEMGMKNHELVPVELIHRISKIKRRGANFEKILKGTLGPAGLVAYEQAGKTRNGYRLTNLGYDYLALHQLMKSGQVAELCSLIGAGKESDVYVALAGESCGIDPNEEMASPPKKPVELNIATAVDESPVIPEKDYADCRLDFLEPIVIKFHRLGRTSFRKVKEKRDYHQHRSSINWLYLDRLAAAREFTMMKALHSAGLPVPRPLACNRSAVAMEYLTNGNQLSRIAMEDLDDPLQLFATASAALVRIAELGLVHGDFNEFNLVVQTHPKSADAEQEDEDQEGPMTIRVIDFPQMVSRDHPTGDELYKRDRKGLVDYFRKVCDIPRESLPPRSLADIERTNEFLDVELRAPGCPKKSDARRHHGRRENLLERFSSIRLGITASSGSSEEEEESEESSDEEKDRDENGVEATLDHPNDDLVEDDDDAASEESTEEDNDGESSKDNKSAIKSGAQVRVTASRGYHTEAHIKERVRRERGKEQDRTFHSKLRRQHRAVQKKEGRVKIKDDLLWS